MTINLKQIISTSLIVGLLGCNYKSSKTPIKIRPRLIQTDSSDGTPFIALISDAESKDIVQLSKNDLAIVDRQVKIAVSEYNIEREKFLHKTKAEDPTATLRREDYIIDLKKYKRQYVACLNTKKQKVVWVNCFCSSRDNDDWKSEVLLVRDGGICYFNLKIIIEQKTYYEFMVNSRA